MGLPEMARYLEIPSIFPRSSDSKSTSIAPSKVLSLQEVNLEKEFSIVKTLSEGCFSKVLLVRQDRERLVLKAIHCEGTSAEEFSRELHYNYFLSPHPNILTSYNVAFLWDSCYIYAQEFAPYGDLSRYLKRGLQEPQVKLIAQQLLSALEFIHSFHLVHRDIRLENILVFRKDFSLVKLGDFGHTLPTGSSITKTSTNWASYCPPEVCEIVLQERYYCHPAEDVWSVGILLVNCLNGDVPWSCADISEPNYVQFTDWLKRRSLRMPEGFQNFTPRFLRLLKRILEPKANKRSKISELGKYLGDDWLLNKGLGRRPSASVERHESNATSRSGRQRFYGKKRSTRSLKLDQELEGGNGEVEPVHERVGKWIQSSVKDSEVD